MKIVVTGATGYIGKHLVSLGLQKNLKIIVASRTKPLSQLVDWIYYDLYSDEPIELPFGTMVVIHLAANTNNDKRQPIDSHVELMAARKLMLLSKAINAKFIFVSSQSVLNSIGEGYGYTKRIIEEELSSFGGWIVRPGLVYGGDTRGLYGDLVDVVRANLFLPAFIPAPLIQPIHVEELAEGLLCIATGLMPEGIYCLGSDEPIPFTKFLKEIAQHRVGKFRVFIPVPVVIIKFLQLFLNKLGLQNPTLDRLDSLFNLRRMSTKPHLFKLDLKLISLRSGLRPPQINGRRALLREAFTFHLFIVNANPPKTYLTNYVRMIERMHQGKSLGLPQAFLNMPKLLSLISDYSLPNSEVKNIYIDRLNGATLLAECSPIGSSYFLGIGKKGGIINSSFVIINALIGAIFWMILGFLLSSQIKKILSKLSTSNV